jgi:hypothetical protein
VYVWDWIWTNVRYRSGVWLSCGRNIPLNFDSRDATRGFGFEVNECSVVRSLTSAM